MTAFSPSAPRSLAGTREQVATRLTFLVAGLAMSAWAPMVPLAKARLGVEEGALGLLLLFLGMGSMVAMPLTGIMTARLGCKRVILGAGALVVATLPLLAVLDDWWALAAALALFGAAIGTIDVAMNVQAVIVERDSDKAMMSGFHGLFSLGGILGAGGVSILLWLGVGVLAAAVTVSLGCALLLVAATSGLLPYGDDGEQQAPLFVMPRGIVVFMGFLALLLFLAEGAVLDWSAVFLITQREADVATAGFGYAIFGVAMTVGRLTGDRIRTLLGEGTVLMAGGLIAAAGFLVTILVPSVAAGLFGFFLIGAGASNVVPVLFSIAGRNRAMPPSLAIASVTTVGYLGILVGPALIGFVAHYTDLKVAFALIAASMLVVSASRNVVTR